LRKGFTLIELLVVLIVIAILVVLAFVAYQFIIERSRGTEAREALGYFRKMCAGIYDRDGSVSNCDDKTLHVGNWTLDQSEISYPSECLPSNYFNYSVFLDDEENGVISFIASRCRKGGRKPDATRAGSISLTVDYKTNKNTWTTKGIY